MYSICLKNSDIFLDYTILVFVFSFVFSCFSFHTNLFERPEVACWCTTLEVFRMLKNLLNKAVRVVGAANL